MVYPLPATDWARCHYCGRELCNGKPHQDGSDCPTTQNKVCKLLATSDHVLPRRVRGRGTVTTKVPACWRCNHDKGDLDYELFIEVVKGVLTRKQALAKQRLLDA